MTFRSPNVATVHSDPMYFVRSKPSLNPSATFEPTKLGLAHRFRLAADAWREDTVFASTTGEKVTNVHFQSIVEMGEAVLPLIFERLQQEPSFLFLAAREITGQDPTTDVEPGDVMAEINAWMEWARNAGLTGGAVNQ